MRKLFLMWIMLILPLYLLRVILQGYSQCNLLSLQKSPLHIGREPSHLHLSEMKFLCCSHPGLSSALHEDTELLAFSRFAQLWNGKLVDPCLILMVAFTLQPMTTALPRQQVLEIKVVNRIGAKVINWSHPPLPRQQSLIRVAQQATGKLGRNPAGFHSTAIFKSGR